MLDRDLSKIFDNIYIIPIRKFQLVEEMGDSRYLLKDYDASHKFEYWDIFSEMKISLLDKIGLSLETLSLFYLEKNLLAMETQYYITDDESLLTHIEISKRQVESINGGSKDKRDIASINADSHRELTRWLGYDSRSLSAFEYFHNVKKANAESESNEIKKLKIA